MRDQVDSRREARCEPGDDAGDERAVATLNREVDESIVEDATASEGWSQVGMARVGA